MTATTISAEAEPSDVTLPARPRPRRTSTWATFRALLLRDLTVLDKGLGEFLANTIIQPLMLAFVFTYVFPHIGQAVGGTEGAAKFSTLLMGGMVAQSVIFQGLFRVALPMGRELDITGELEDRVMAPSTVTTIALEKVVAGALQGLFAGLVVFPVAAFVPATPVFLSVNWPVLLTVTPLACTTSAALGLVLGSRFEPRSVPMLASFFALPLAFFGAIFYPWDALTPIPWLKVLVLVNPLVYMSEGFRAALTVGVPHMPLLPIYGVLIGSTVLLTVIGTRSFRDRVLS
ncbi:MAG: ABC transporter permease [Actinomycetota bacterium]|nr:ABC transporter permease [Actinomycetota bacterium]